MPDTYIKDVLSEMICDGYSVLEILEEIQNQLELWRDNAPRTETDTRERRKVSIAITNLETSVLYLQNYQTKTSQTITLGCLLCNLSEDDNLPEVPV